MTMRRLPLLLCCCLALGAIARAQEISTDDLRKLREDALKVADAMIAFSRKEIETIERRSRRLPDDENVRQKHLRAIEFCELYKKRHQTLQEIQEYQRQCERQELFGKEHVEKLDALDKLYNETDVAMSKLAAEYQARYGVPVANPYQYLLDKYFPPDAARANKP
jgi:ATP-dependent Clp protease ATP-binding subunit ClpA